MPSEMFDIWLQLIIIFVLSPLNPIIPCMVSLCFTVLSQFISLIHSLEVKKTYCFSSLCNLVLLTLILVCFSFKSPICSLCIIYTSIDVMKILQNVWPSYKLIIYNSLNEHWLINLYIFFSAWLHPFSID